MFLGIFLVIPICVMLSTIYVLSSRTSASLINDIRLPFVIVLHIIIAVVWTTPWDNYLVASKVWWYDETLVTGITIGYVPIEEYTFFVLQPIFTALWLALVSTRAANTAPAAKYRSYALDRLIVAGIVLAIGLAALFYLWGQNQSGRYLSLELAWVAPPLALQFAFGADILWRNRRLLFLTIAPATIFLSVADAIAIDLGIWTIDPAQTIGIKFGGILPLEEAFFFLITNTLVAFGVTLALSRESYKRLQAIRFMPLKLGRQALN